MKKTYAKPKMFAESFALAEHIASCKVGQGITTVDYQDGYACSYSDANVTLFYEGNTKCSSGWDTEIFLSLDEYLASFGVDRGGCYNAFADGNFFAS